MSVRLMADVWDSAMEGSTAVHVMAVLANSADDDGTNCFPGTRKIAKRARVSERTVIRTIQELEAAGYLRIGVRGQGAGRFSEYFLNAVRLHDEAEKTRSDEREKRRHGVTFSREPKKVTPVQRKGDIGARKGDIGARKGDIGGAPLFVLPVSDTSLDPALPQPLAREGRREVEIERAVDQVCSALGISNRRRRKPVRCAIEMAAEKGEALPTIALEIIAAVKRQAQLHARRLLKSQFGLHKFLGDGIWRDENRWVWDNTEARLQAEASIGSMR